MMEFEKEKKTIQVQQTQSVCNLISRIKFFLLIFDLVCWLKSKLEAKHQADKKFVYNNNIVFDEKRAYVE